MRTCIVTGIIPVNGRIRLRPLTKQALLVIVIVLGLMYVTMTFVSTVILYLFEKTCYMPQLFS